MNCFEERTDDEHEQSSMCAEWTRPLLERFSFSSQEPVAFGHVRFENRWSDDIFQADEKHVIQVFC